MCLNSLHLPPKSITYRHGVSHLTVMAPLEVADFNVRDVEMTGGQVKTEIAHVLFVDIVEFSLKSLEEQADAIASLRSLVKRSTIDCPQPIVIDTGDGMALAFFDSASSAVQTAIKVATDVRLRSGEPVRMGIHSGPITRLRDSHDNDNIVGPGINVAQRVMACGDPGHILLSQASAQLLASQIDNQSHVVDLGPCEVKHGEVVHLANFVGEHFGRTSRPTILIRQDEERSMAPRHNIPQEERALIGRTPERNNLVFEICDQRRRLVTITGIGGMGKTRLGNQVAFDSLSAFRDGVWLIECDTLLTLQELVARLAAVLAISAEHDLESAIIRALKNKQALLLFDCFEKLVENAGFLERILRHTVSVQILVTSRVVLHLPREHEFALGPMSNQPQPYGTADGVALFIEAAGHVFHGYAPKRRAIRMIGKLVEAVESVPLAILLAAGRLRYLSLDELTHQVETRRLEILKRHPVGDDRHANLQRVVDDSFALLGSEEQWLLIRLAVFRGGFFLSDVSAVFGDDSRLFDVVARLRDHSLLSADVTLQQMRYRSLDTVLEYLDRIGADQDLNEVRLCHAEHFAAKAEQIRKLHDTGVWVEINRRLLMDLGNFRSAISFAKEGHDNLVKRFAMSLARGYFEIGIRRDFDELTDLAATVAIRDRDTRLLIEMRGLQGAASRRDGHATVAERFWLERSELCRESGDDETYVDCLLDVCDLAMSRNDLGQVTDILKKIEQSSGRIRSAGLRSATLVMRARLEIGLGHLSQARKTAGEAERIATQGAIEEKPLYVFRTLAEILRSLGLFQKSESMCRRLIQDGLAGGYLHSCAVGLLELHLTLMSQSKWDEAAIPLCIALEVPRDVSSSIRERSQRLRQDFIKARGSRPLEIARAQSNKEIWTDAAHRMIG